MHDNLIFNRFSYLLFNIKQPTTTPSKWTHNAKQTFKEMPICVELDLMYHHCHSTTTFFICL